MNNIPTCKTFSSLFVQHWEYLGGQNMFQKDPQRTGVNWKQKFKFHSLEFSTHFFNQTENITKQIPEIKPKKNSVILTYDTCDLHLLVDVLLDFLLNFRR